MIYLVIIPISVAFSQKSKIYFKISKEDCLNCQTSYFELVNAVSPFFEMVMVFNTNNQAEAQFLLGKYFNVERKNYKMLPSITLFDSLSPNKYSEVCPPRSPQRSKGRRERPKNKSQV